MAPMYISITKRGNFQGRGEEFSNIYLYEVGAKSEATGTTMINALVEIERALFGNAVTFTRGRAYTTDAIEDGLESGNMYAVVELGGTGSRPAGALPMYRECAFLVKFDLPRKVGLLGSLGRQRSLKKWLHTFNSLGASSDMIEGVTPLTGGAAIAPLTTYANAIKQVGANALIAPDGTPAGNLRIHPYIEHRQFPPGRKHPLTD